MKNLLKSVVFITGVILVIAIVLTGCTGGNSSGTSIAVTGVTLKSSTALLVGGIEQLTATIVPSRYSKGSSFTVLKDHTLHILSRSKPLKKRVRYGMEGGKYEDTETKIYPVV